ncbi:hypothetical protein AB5J62_01040 [Amycolatopsis sp. cg5]|uniref:hypothetical protein n=1 Tax=Amycolatopsis sp. cg5 TaxID=3238802 RepID=UPI003524DAAE
MSETTSGGRRTIGRALRDRFGFSLIQAPLRQHVTPWAEEPELPGPRRELVAAGNGPAPEWNSRPIVEQLELHRA